MMTTEERYARRVRVKITKRVLSHEKKRTRTIIREEYERYFDTMANQKGSTVTSGMNVNPPSKAVQTAAVSEPSPEKAKSYGYDEMKSDASPAPPSTSSAITNGFRSNAGDPVSVSVKAVDQKDVSADFAFPSTRIGGPMNPGDSRAQATGNTSALRGNENNPRAPMGQQKSTSKLDTPAPFASKTTKGA
jgi:hypothetical protein